jgi:hypothetical protein
MGGIETLGREMGRGKLFDGHLAIIEAHGGQ